MDDNYFDKKLKDILESHPKIEPDSSAVQDMQQRLKSIQKPGRQRSILPFLMASLLLLMLSGMLFFYKKYDTLHSEVLKLNQQINTQETRIDTIIQKQIIFQIDTVYNTIYHEIYITKKQATEQQPFIASNIAQWYANTTVPSRVFNPSVTIDWSSGEEKNSLFAKNPGSSIFYNFPFNRTQDVSTNAIEAELQAPDLVDTKSFHINYSKDLGLLPQFDHITPATINKDIHPAYYFMPTGFSVGATYSPFFSPIHEYGGGGYTLGVKGAIQFPAGRSLEIGGEFLSTNLKVEDNPDQFADFPIVDPENPNDVLHEIKGTFEYLQIPVMLRQEIKSIGKFTPSISAGIVAVRPLNQKLIYEYFDAGGEYKISNNLSAGTFSADHLKFGLGTDYALSNAISANLGLQYQHGFSLPASEYFKLRYFALNLGLRYTL